MLSTLLFPFAAAMTPAPAIAPVEEIVVTATRRAARSVDTPASIDQVDVANIRTRQPMVNLSESLAAVPGLTLNNRQNYAQDLQISSRGFGSRATFGIRGLRLLVDELPATFPDGQAQGAVVPLASLERIEVLRGPWAVAYGNASGGVIHAFSARAGRDPGVRVDAYAGPYRQQRVGVIGEGSLKLGGAEWGVRADISRFAADGFRAHSRVERSQLALRADADLGDKHSLTLILNALEQPDTQDPLGLTRAQFDADPRQAGTGAEQFNTRKSVRQQQAGAVLRGEEGAWEWTAVAHGGARRVVQFLSTPVGAQTPATSSGGVVDLDRKFAGASLRIGQSHAAWQWLAGVELEQSEETRRGFNNFDDAGRVGVAGRLRRDEDTRVRGADAWAQATWTASPAWRVMAGLRSSSVKFRVTDRFIASGNADDSGSLSQRATTPTFGVLHSLSDGLNVYASIGRGFETPTAVELAYRTDGASGLNTELRAGGSRHAEVGLKWRQGLAWRANIAAFTVRTDDEIVPASNAGGRTTFRNGGETTRRGLEASLRWRPDDDWQLALAGTWLTAKFDDGFSTTTIVSGVATTRTVAAGNALPGVPSRTLNAQLNWREGQPGWSAAIEANHRGRMWADDRNTAFAPAATTLGARVSHRSRVQALNAEVTWYVRADNLTDRRFTGSVIVNEANERYFESAPGRGISAGANIRW
ncbi:MAG: TonB-dependent receptor [Burkholderiales bacterium]|nr:TonB-dependent receptor [Burkholderiales bacterium]